MSTALPSATGHLAIERGQVGQPGPAFHKPMQIVPDLTVFLRLPCEHTPGEPLHNLSCY